MVLMIEMMVSMMGMSCDARVSGLRPTTYGFQRVLHCVAYRPLCVLSRSRGDARRGEPRENFSGSKRQVWKRHSQAVSAFQFHFGGGRSNLWGRGLAGWLRGLAGLLLPSWLAACSRVLRSLLLQCCIRRSSCLLTRREAHANTHIVAEGAHSRRAFPLALLFVWQRVTNCRAVAEWADRESSEQATWTFHRSLRMQA